MAERLKTKLLEEDSVDFICGPDAYRDIPQLVDIASSTDQKAANVQLSLEETYADLRPVREVSSISAFVSIMRGCNNMCSCKCHNHNPNSIIIQFKYIHRLYSSIHKGERAFT
jgi:tRNA A37 methylthiotransferase MiaB